MNHKRLVIDANILIRAVLGSRVRNLIEQHCQTVNFYIAEANAKEAKYYLSKELAKKYHLTESWNSVFQAVMDIVQVIPTDALIDLEIKAKARIITRDINDWPAVAAALLLECPVWNEDKDFFGSGIATWTTATIELYLSEK